MMTLGEARAAIGRAVLYQPVRGQPEEGLICSVNDLWVFVRFGTNQTAAATPADQLTLMASLIVDEYDFGQLLAVATLYVGAFKPDEKMTLPEKMRLQEIEAILERHGRRY
jgi:hypothetical protein